jgi:hypothetical protein
MKRISTWMPSWAWVLFLAAFAQVVLAFANRDVYEKMEVDNHIEAVRTENLILHENIDRKLDNIRDDVRWLMRHLVESGNVPARQDSSASQFNGR